MEIFSKKEAQELKEKKADKYCRTQVYKENTFYKLRHLKESENNDKEDNEKLQVSYLNNTFSSYKGNTLKEFKSHITNKEKKFRKQIDFKMDQDANSVPFLPGLWFLSLFHQINETQWIKLKIPDSYINGYGFPTGGIAFTRPDGYLDFKSELTNIEKEDFLSQISVQKKSFCSYLAPALIFRVENSEFNKIVMPDDSEGNDKIVNVENLPQDVVVQKFIISKGKLAGKVRVC